VRQIETGPKLRQEAIHRFLVEIGAPIAPALLPKRVVATGHDCADAVPSCALVQPK
jgi:hypothetical protein